MCEKEFLQFYIRKSEVEYQKRIFLLFFYKSFQILTNLAELLIKMSPFDHAQPNDIMCVELHTHIDNIYLPTVCVEILILSRIVFAKLLLLIPNCNCKRRMSKSFAEKLLSLPERVISFSLSLSIFSSLESAIYSLANRTKRNLTLISFSRFP